MNENITLTEEFSDVVSTPKMNITVDFSLLSAQLSGAVEKNENGIEFLVMPQQQTVLESILLTNAVDGINDFFKKLTESDEFKLNIQAIFDKIGELVSDIILENLKVSIKQVFIHFIKPKQEKPRLEYAFSIGVDITDKKMLVGISYVQLKALTFGIWNTDNKKIIEKMGLLDISERLG